MTGLAFHNPLLLYGALLGAIPLIIHLLNRRRFRVEPWAAMKFLLEAYKENRRRLRIEQLLLLLARILLLVLIALAMARPFLKSSTLAGTGILKPRKNVLLLLDNSFSMGRRSGQHSLFDLAKGVAHRVIENLKEGDKLSLVLFSDHLERVIPEPSPLLDAVQREVGLATLSDSPTNVPLALREAFAWAKRAAGHVQQVIVITDLQRAGWLESGAANDRTLNAELEELGKIADVVIVDVGEGNPANRAVTAIKVSQRAIIVGEVTTFEATVTNFSEDSVQTLVVEFIVDERKQRTRSIKLPSRGQATVRFLHVFHDTDDHVISVRLEHDSLEVDDSRSLVVRARTSIPVLTIDGAREEGRGEGETRYIRIALDPAGPDGRISPFAPELTTPARIRPSTLQDFDVIVMANVSLLTDDVAKAIFKYVRDGGGLLVFAGDRLNPDFYNKTLFDGCKGVLPAQLVDINTAARNKPFILTPESYNHPILAMFRGLKTIPLSSPLITTYYRVNVPTNCPGTTIVCKYNTGDPAILERELGRGKCIFFTTAADTDWSSLPQNPVFLPLVHESVLHLARNTDSSKNLLVGDPYVRALKPREYSGKFVLEKDQELSPRRDDEDFQPVLLAGSQTDDGFQLVYAENMRAGVYRVERNDAPGRDQLFCVNLSPVESDLTRVPPEAIEKAFPQFRFRYATDVSQLTVRSGTSRDTSELWKAALWLLLALVCLESFLAHRFAK